MNNNNNQNKLNIQNPISLNLSQETILIAQLYKIASGKQLNGDQIIYNGLMHSVYELVSELSNDTTFATEDNQVQQYAQMQQPVVQQLPVQQVPQMKELVQAGPKTIPAGYPMNPIVQPTQQVQQVLPPIVNEPIYQNVQEQPVEKLIQHNPVVKQDPKDFAFTNTIDVNDCKSLIGMKGAYYNSKTKTHRFTTKMHNTFECESAIKCKNTNKNGHDIYKTPTSPFKCEKHFKGTKFGFKKC